MKGVILSGSPALASAGDEGGFNQAILDLDVPILGFCFGHQEIAKRYGGKVEHCRSEYGPARLEVTGQTPVFDGPKDQTVG
jgi:GMP synthase (glutamine-hydrolysing)